MEVGKWVSTLTDPTPGSETSEAVLYLLHFGALVPVLKVSSDGVFQVKDSTGAWQGMFLTAD